jgi:2-oxoglutarate ferredoxin oxidoreductase subunit beta
VVELASYQNAVESQWCPGCPNFGILKALKQALVKLDRSPHEVCLVSGIGQAAKLPHYLNCNFFNGLHGRAIPAAVGVSVANPSLITIVATGDGDCYGEGGNHFLHALRRNPDITVVIHNNQIYALTKGQASPTTGLGERTRLQFEGVALLPAQMLATAIVHGCTFVARGFAGEIESLADILSQAIQHPGLSIVEVIQPCLVWGTHPLSWYRERIRPLPPNYDPTSREAALGQLLESGARISLGVLYRDVSRPSFGAHYRQQFGAFPLAELPPFGEEALREHLRTHLFPSSSERAISEER